jgi:mono/diheme cytochrome c family protein
VNQKKTVSISFIILIPLFILFVENFKYNNPQNHNTKQADTAKVWKAPGSAAKIKNPLADNKKAAQKGAALFSQNCIECHGDEGKGDGPNADLLDVKPADLTSSKVQNESDGALFWKISNGKGPMAAYKNTLSKEQRWQLVSYIRKLKNKN